MRFYQVYSLREILIETSAQITFKASDGDELTSDTSQVLVLDSIQKAAPIISVPKSKISVKAEKEASLPGIKITDIDSSTISVDLSAPSGIFKGINPVLYNVQGLDSSNVTIIGSPSAINVALEDLKYVGVQGSGNNIEITVDSKDEIKSALEKGTLSINVVDNQPPEPGGDLVFKSGSDISQNAAVDEDTTSNPTITFNIPVAKLVNSDGETPTDIRILSVAGVL